MATFMKANPARSPGLHRLARRTLIAAACLLLGACATAPVPRSAGTVPPAPVQVPLPPTRVFYYPNAGQSPAQQDRDRYECYLWAVKQTGFDPNVPRYASRVRVEVVPALPPGYGTVIGAASGALLGAAITHPHNAGEGALVGAIAGGAIGAASDVARQEQAERIREAYEQSDAARLAAVERRAADYRRAMSACLAGRGYTVH